MVEHRELVRIVCMVSDLIHIYKSNFENNVTIRQNVSVWIQVKVLGLV